MERTTLYLCNPEKNWACPKTNCAFDAQAVHRSCYCTKNPSCAVLDENGHPIDVPDWSVGQLFEELKYLTRMLEEERGQRATDCSEYRRGVLHGTVTSLVGVFCGTVITSLLHLL